MRINTITEDFNALKGSLERYGVPSSILENLDSLKERVHRQTEKKTKLEQELKKLRSQV